MNTQRNVQRSTQKSSDIVTLYFSTTGYDLDSVINAIPNANFISVLESWKTTKLIEKEGFHEIDDNGEEKAFKRKANKKSFEVTEAVLIVDKRDINPLKYYLKVTPHRNFYPREDQDPTSLYCVFTPVQKKETDRLLKLFCSKMELKVPKFVPGNGFSFYIFETDDYVPQIIGLLNSYPSLGGAKFRYGRKRGYVKREEGKGEGKVEEEGKGREEAEK